MKNICPQCHIEFDGIQCPGCHQYWTKDTAAVDARMPICPLPPRKFTWGTALAHWGDTIAAMSMARQIMERQGLQSCNIAYAGRDPLVVEFLRAQSWIDDAIFLQAQNYRELYRVASTNLDANAWWNLVEPAEEGAVKPPVEEVWGTHNIAVTGVHYKAVPVRCLSLPPARVEWARAAWEREGLKDREGLKIMVHPMSVWSAGSNEHWPFWKEAMEWLLANTEHTYVWTGIQKAFEIEHPRLVDLVGQTPSNMEVFALAELCDGVVSTCNSLSMWTVTQNLPGLICGNAAIVDKGNYFRRFIDRAPNVYVDLDESLGRFISIAKDWAQDPRAFADCLETFVARIQRTEVIRSSNNYHVNGIVAGRNRDYWPGQQVREEDLHGDVRVYVDLGVLSLIGESIPRSVLLGET